MSADLLRVYLDPAEIGPDGYPYVWSKPSWLQDWGTEPPFRSIIGPPNEEHVRAWQEERDVTVSWEDSPPVKHLIRELAGHRCVRCGHPYPPGITETCPRGEWTPCDERCAHGGPVRDYYPPGGLPPNEGPEGLIEAQWRILTTHHLNGVKHDCRWWNLAALCQRCHLTIQGKVVMHREWNREHSEWFKPYAAGFYAAEFLGEDLTREETMARLDELLDLQLTQHPLPEFP